MKKQPKKLALSKETLRDLLAHNAGEVNGGAKSKNCATGGKATACGYTCGGGTQNYQCIPSAYGCW